MVKDGVFLKKATSNPLWNYREVTDHKPETGSPTGQFNPLTRHIHRHLLLHTWNPVLSPRRDYLLIRIVKSTHCPSTRLPTTQSEDEQKRSGNAFLSTALTHPSGRKEKNSKELQNARKTGNRRGSNQGSTGYPECTRVVAKGFSLPCKKPASSLPPPNLEAKTC